MILNLTHHLWGYVWVVFTLLLPILVKGQSGPLLDQLHEPMYYVGLNPVAPIANIKGNFTSGYLPAISNLETGASAFVGKIWERNYNVETRVSFGSPVNNHTLFLVQSGFNYCFSSTSKNWQPYAGSFIKIYSLHDNTTKNDYASLVGYLCAGNRFIRKNLFLDLRISEHVSALSWSSTPDTKARNGFSPSLYKWSSPYLPFIGVGLGILLR